MPSGRRDLQGPFGVLLSLDVREIHLSLCGRQFRQAQRGMRLQRVPAGKMRHQLAQGVDGIHLDIRNQRGLGRVFRGHV